jgi:hypothetical protein
VAESLPVGTRIWFAFACFFRILFDAGFAARAWSVREGMPELPAPEPEKPKPEKPKAEKPKPRDLSPALQLLSLLQRDGRLVDFLKQDIASFDDADIGAAARAVHEGCKKALAGHVEIEPLRSEAEGDKVTLDAGFDASEIKLTGNVSGSGPWRGNLRHKGWRAKKVDLPVLTEGHDASVLAPAEVEL